MLGIERVVSIERCCNCGRAGAAICPQCEKELRPPPLTCEQLGDLRVLSGLAYEGAARSLVLALKLRGRRAAAEVLVEHMSRAVLNEGLRAEALAWVPGRKADIRRRGFDHAHALAQGLSGALGLPLIGLLGRRGTSADQSGLGREERWLNVSRAFEATATSRPIAVVDDLVTSGATAAAVAYVLTEKGAPGVEIVAACRRARGRVPGPSL